MPDRFFSAFQLKGKKIKKGKTLVKSTNAGANLYLHKINFYLILCYTVISVFTGADTFGRESKWKNNKYCIWKRTSPITVICSYSSTRRLAVTRREIYLF